MTFQSPVTPEIREKAAEAAAESTRKACEDVNVGLTALLTKLKQELNWKETKTIKVKGYVDQNKLPRGFRVIATSGVILRDKEGNVEASDGETLIMWQEKAGGIRQKARMDAHDLRGDYPEKGLKSGSQSVDAQLMDTVVRTLHNATNKPTQAPATSQGRQESREAEAAQSPGSSPSGASE